MNITIDDTSPQVQYYSKGRTNTWLIEHSADDQTHNYYKGTFYATNTDGDWVTFTFNGTAIWIFGAKRDNHGVYSSQIDDGEVKTELGYEGKMAFQDVLFSAAGLASDQEHTVVLTNLPSQTTPPGNSTLSYWFDIDYAIVRTSTTGKVYTSTYDDMSPSVQYSGDGWKRGNPHIDYFQTTVHYTANPGDTMQLSFTGSSIQLIGALGMDHGNYTVSLDGGPPEVYNGTFFRLEKQVALYTASGLEDDPHVVTLGNFGHGPNGASILHFDYAQVNSTIDPSAPSNTTTTNPGATGTPGPDGSSDNTGSEGGSSNAAAVAGGVVGGVVGLALVAVLAWFLFKRSRANKEGAGYVLRTKERMDLDGGEVKPFQHPNNSYHYPLPSTASSEGRDVDGPYAQPLPLSYSSEQAPAAREMDQSHTPFLTTVPAPPPSNATSYPRSVNPPSSAGASSPPPVPDNLNPFSVAASTATFGHGHGSSPDPSTSGHSYSASQSRTPTGVKVAGVALPYTAQPVTRPRSGEETSPTLQPPVAAGRERASSFNSTGSGRMFVPGREVDVGPLPVRSDEDDGHSIYGTLPPDYTQATEPLPGQRRT